MTADRDAGVDPRFDPMFQRGYDPALNDERPARPSPRRTTAQTPVTPVSPIEERDAVPDVDTPAAEAEPRGRNPFLLALLLVSIVSAGGSALLLWQRLQNDPYADFNYTQTPTDIFLSQFVEVLMAPLLTGALVGFCLWLALWAIRPKRPRD